MHEDIDYQLIIYLQLLIARAAQKDSLNWWEDDSLTSSGDYLLDRLFFVDAETIRRKLALEAAKVRYQTAFNKQNGVIHLFHLDHTGMIDLLLEDIKLSKIVIPSRPITSIDELRSLLIEFIGEPMDYKIIGEHANNSLEIIIENGSTNLKFMNLVKTLAWATLEGKPNKVVFPYIRENQLA